MGERDDILTPGQVFGKYEIQKLLGKGGMGAVYLVRHTVLDSLFALKVLFPEAAAKNRQFVDRFLREAKLACKIKHPNLIAVHDAGESDGVYYLVMDYVPGENLRHHMLLEWRFTVPRAARIVRELASALAAAHAFNMVHRDIKPENIMFDASGAAKLADLGIAKSSDDGGTALTMDASVFGTPAYMSPEQARDPRKVDCRADLYSVGVLLYEMLGGERPYSGASPVEVLSQVLDKAPIPDVRTVNADVPAGFARLIADLCEKNIKKRIQTPEELLERLDALEAETQAPQTTMATMATLATAAPVAGGSVARPERRAKTSGGGAPRLLKEGLLAAAAVLVLAAVCWSLRGPTTRIPERTRGRDGIPVETVPDVPGGVAGTEQDAPSDGKPAEPTAPAAEAVREPAETEAPKQAAARTMAAGSVVVIGDASLGGEVFVPKSRQDWYRLIGAAAAADSKKIILAPAAWYDARRLPRGNFEHFVLGLATNVRLSGIPFAFLLDASPFSARVKTLCDGKSHQSGYSVEELAEP